MDSTIIKKLFDSPEYYNYLKENSQWVKLLKRHPEKWNEFVKYVKQKYKLRVQDKVNTAINSASVLSEVLSTLK